ncbi:hypothetical protein FQR65_LT15772 [Abscondita terminalis]|nr:hypothetical protein FQR65_LT15772 [Abscondita terminalis]
MNDSLKQIGWGAATVDGFIPPSAFMEFQAHRVLVIAADIRQLEHIEYHPPSFLDIFHESSGHAPINRRICGDPSEIGFTEQAHGGTVRIWDSFGHPDCSKIYGAGLLSSIGECFLYGKGNPKLPYSPRCAELCHMISHNLSPIICYAGFCTSEKRIG